jgi:hypothetical protein
MIVDDHPGVRQLIRHLVATARDIVCECASGDEAIRMAPNFQPDAVTMDVRLPGTCGLTAARAIRTAHPAARIVIVTSHDQPDLGHTAAEAGAVGFVLKDNLADLKEMLRIPAPLVAPGTASKQNPKPVEWPAEPTGQSASGTGVTPAETKLLARIAELEEEKRDLKTFACSIAHDLHAPLRAVRAAVATLQREGFAGETQLPLRRIDDGCRQLSERIDALLTLARVEQRPIQFQKVCMDAVLEDALSEACSDEERARVELRIAPLPQVWGDRTLLQLVFAILLSNAFKFSARHARPAIEVGCVTGGSDEATFFIKDNGTGFDMRYASRLFQPFGRLHAAEEFAGLGLGLATARRIVQRHHGRLSAEAAQTHGATFYLTVPTVPAAEKRA